MLLLPVVKFSLHSVACTQPQQFLSLSFFFTLPLNVWKRARASSRPRCRGCVEIDGACEGETETNKVYGIWDLAYNLCQDCTRSRSRVDRDLFLDHPVRRCSWHTICTKIISLTLGSYGRISRVEISNLIGSHEANFNRCILSPTLRKEAYSIICFRHLPVMFDSQPCAHLCH
ncbi:hypothetical protein RRG08_061817 [Elysia crispata]|uniref:Uncharacterized protein n=1 Tax=Elysia crispata TaxID=231223 RepID=A0AAE1A2I0_9GAST|nr:hypothetical protein RRG08_061817 [Elysia crispata]